MSSEDIKNAYRRLAKKYHPDINPGDAVASEKFKNLKESMIECITFIKLEILLKIRRTR